MTPVELPDGTHVQLYKDGEALHAAYQAIEEAASRVWLEIYIFHSDGTGRAFAELLARRAREGLKVRVVYDAIGSILVGVLLGWVAVYLLRRNMAFLVGEVADPQAYDTVLGWLGERAEVQSVSTLHLEYVGPDKLFLVGSVDLVGDDPESEAAAELQRLEDHLEERPEIARAVLSLAAPGRPPMLGNKQSG